MAITIKWEDREWPYDDDHLTVQQAMAFQSVHGFTLHGWTEGIKELDPRAFQCIYWLMLQQNGEQTTLKDLDFDLIEFMSAYVEAIQAEGERRKALEEQAEPDPTQDSPPDGSTPRPPGSSKSPSAKSAASTSSSLPAPATSELPL